jgi:hypothetical protein
MREGCEARLSLRRTATPKVPSRSRVGHFGVACKSDFAQCNERRVDVLLHVLSGARTLTGVASTVSWATAWPSAIVALPIALARFTVNVSFVSLRVSPLT